MQKNFVQRHALFFSVIVFCFVIVPFIRNAYAQEKADKVVVETVIRTQSSRKINGLFWMPVTAAMMTAVLRRMAQRKKQHWLSVEAGCGCCVYTSAGQEKKANTSKSGLFYIKATAGCSG